MTKTENSPELRFENVSFLYESGAPFGLRDVSLSLRPGSVTALLGPNGSGKTTLMKLANRRLSPTSGRIYYAEKDLSESSRRDVARAVGFVPQAERIAFDYSVLDYVLMGRAPWLSPLAVPSAPDIAIAAQALADVGVETLARRSVRKISGGQLQLVLLARALTQSTQVLLLDEASSALDLANKRRFLTIIRTLAERGKTILLSTHEPAVAESIVDQVILIKNGVIQASGDIENVFTETNLSNIYETELKVIPLDGRKVVLWT